MNQEDRTVDKTLLIISNSYPDEKSNYINGMFVKKQVDELKNYFKNIIVISPVLFSFNISNKDKFCKNYQYQNVSVFYPRSFYIPILWTKCILIDNRSKKTEQCIRKNNIRFDLIHAHFIWPSGFIASKLSSKYGKPFLITSHENTDWLIQVINSNCELISNSLHSARCIIRVNQRDIRLLSDYNKNIIYIPNGFTTEKNGFSREEARKVLKLPPDSKIIFSLGNLIKRKGYQYLIESMRMVLQNQNDVYCYIGGEGKEKNHLQNTINEYNLSDNVKLLGYLNDEEVDLWMTAMDIFVLPSLSEGNPTVMFEALGHGRPFIGTEVGGEPEIITSDEFGYLAEPSNAANLKEIIMKSLKRDWNENIIKEYAQNFSWSNISEQLIPVYWRTCNEKIQR